MYRIGEKNTNFITEEKKPALLLLVWWVFFPNYDHELLDESEKYKALC